MPGMAPRKERSSAGTDFDTRLIDVPLSPPVASVSANTVPPAAKMLMAKPTQDDVGLHAQVEERHHQAEHGAGDERRKHRDVPGRVNRDDHCGEAADQHHALRAPR